MAPTSFEIYQFFYFWDEAFMCFPIGEFDSMSEITSFSSN
jgi:hypothetical protein